MLEIPVYNRDWITDRIPEEALMEYYLGVPVSRSLIRSPLRKDSSPTCGFFVKNGSLLFKDFRGDFVGDFIAVVRYKFNLSYKQAIRKVIEDFDLIKKSSKPSYPIIREQSTADIKVKTREWTDKDLKYWGSYGISKETLSKYRVYPIQYLWLNEELQEVKNCYGYYFLRNRWKIYFPLKRTTRFLCNTDVLQGYSQLPETGDYVVVTKSLKDVMTLYELGVAAVAPQAESVVISDSVYKDLASRFKYVVVNYDWDRAGCRGMAKTRRKYNVICLSFNDKLDNSKKDSKDISDYVKKHGAERGRLLIEECQKLIESGTIGIRSRGLLTCT